MNAVKLAVRFSRILDELPAKDREGIVTWLWFYYCGRFIDSSMSAFKRQYRRNA